jgi:Kinesin motor domain
MEGDLDNPDQFGVIPRAAQSIFECLQQSTYLEAKVSCSYLEIYNEELSDLLVTDHVSKLDIVQGVKGVQCRGLSQHEVQSARDVLKLMQEAIQTRHVGETNMNKHSSRSHCIFTICVDTKQKLPNGSIMEAQGKLHMVDLAGSESAKTALVEQSSQREQAAREQERRNINKSLLTLGRVISILKEQSENKNKTAMIPYRYVSFSRMSWFRCLSL